MITTAVTYTHRQTDRQTDRYMDKQTDRQTYLISVKCVFLVTSLSTTAVTQTQTSSSRRPPTTREHHSDITHIMSYYVVTIVKITELLT